MAKINKNAQKFKIQWDGDLSKPSDGSAQSSPDNINLGTWGAGKQPIPYKACHADGNASDCTADLNSYFFEDFDVDGNGSIDILDVIAAVAQGAPSNFTNQIVAIGVIGSVATPPKGPITFTDSTDQTFTWGDVSFIQEIMDGIGSGSRRARQDRLNKILDDEDKKKKLIHLICRVKGEKVYDDYTESGNIEVKVEDVELVAENIIGKVKLEIKSGV